MCENFNDHSTLEAYHYGNWSIWIFIEEGAWFEGENTFVLYFDVSRDGRRLGRIDVVTKLEILENGLGLRAYDTDMHGLEPNKLGLGGISAIAQVIMESNNVDYLVVEGNYRTTGANPGHRPGRKPFRRQLGSVRKGYA